MLAPEHPVVDWITTDARREEVQQYRERAGATDLVTRKKTDKEKTGVHTGAYAVNPATGEEILRCLEMAKIFRKRSEFNETTTTLETADAADAADTAGADGTSP